MKLHSEGSKAMVWSFTEVLLKRGVQFILSIFLARLLTPDDFGVVAMATIFVTWSEVFKDFGLGQALIQKKDISEEQVSTVFYLNIGMGGLLALILVLIAPFASKFYENEMVGWCVRVSALTFLITSFNVVQTSLLKKKLNYKVQTVASFLSSTISGIVGVVMAYKGFGVWSLLTQSVVHTIINTLYLWRKSDWRPKWVFKFKSTYPLFRKGVGFMGKGFIDNIFSALDSMAIGKLFSSSALGLFNRGRSLSDMVRDTFLIPVTRPLFPIFSKLQNDRAAIEAYYFKMLYMLSWIILLTAGLLFLCSEEVITILYGDAWRVSAIYLKYFALLLPFYVPNTIATSTLKALGQVKVLVYLGLFERILAFASLFCLLVGLDVYMKAFFATNLFASVVQVIITSRYTKISVFKQYKNIVLCVLGIVALGLAFYYMPDYNKYVSFAIKASIFTVVYLIYSTLSKSEGFDACLELVRNKKHNKIIGKEQE